MYYSGDHIKNEIGEVRWSGETHTRFWSGNLMERCNLDYLSIDGRLILQWSFKKWYWVGWGGGGHGLD